MEVRCIAFTKNGRCKRKGRWLCHQHIWSFPLQIILAIGFLIGVWANLGNIRDIFFPKEKPLYLNLSAIDSNGKWMSFHPDHITIWMEEYNPNNEAIEIQILGGSVQSFFSDGRAVSNIGKTILPPQAPIMLGPMQKQIATAYLLITPSQGKINLFDTLLDGSSHILVDTNVRFRRMNSENWYTMEIKYTLNAKGWTLISRNLVNSEQISSDIKPNNQDPDLQLSTFKAPPAEDTAKKVSKNSPKQPQQDERRPFFTAGAKIIVDEDNNIQSLDFTIINVGKLETSTQN